MPRVYRLLWAGFCLLLVVTVSAQDEQPLPDTNEIFTDAVEVISVTRVENPLSRYVFDNERRVVIVSDPDTNTSLEYPFPDEIEDISEVRPFRGNLLLSTTRNRGIFGNQPDPLGQWILDIETGIFSRPEIFCDEIRDLSGEGRWVTSYYAEREQPLELCHTETGERRPLNVSEGAPHGTSQSPDGAHVIIFGWFNVYVYVVATEELIILREDNGFDVSEVHWLGNNRFILFQTDSRDSYPWHIYFYGTVGAIYSLNWIGSVLKPDHLTMRDNPLRYEWIENRDGDCWLVQAFIDDGHLVDYPLGDICEQGILLGSENDRLARVIVRDASDYPITARLIHFNPYTSSQQTIYEGEIEWIMDISPDNRHAVLIVDDNGYIDSRIVYETVNLNGYFPAELYDQRWVRPELVIIDLLTGDIRFRLTTRWELDYFFDTLDGGYRSVFFWETDGEFYGGPTANLIGAGNSRFVLHFPVPEQCLSTTLFCPDRLVEVNADSIHITLLPFMARETLPDHNMLLLLPEDSKYILYDIASRQIIPIFETAFQPINPIYVRDITDEEYILFTIDGMFYTVRVLP